MKTIKKIDAWSVAKVSVILNALFGFMLGLFMMLVSFFVPTSEGEMMPWFFAVGAPIALPILYGIIGLVAGYVMALLYNLGAKWVGGIKIEIQD